MHCELICGKLSGSENVILTQDSSVNEVDYFSLIIKSNTKLENHILLLTDIPLEIVGIENHGLDSSIHYYTIKDSSVKQYFIDQNFESVFDVYKTIFPFTENSSNVFYYKLFLNYPIGRCEIRLFDLVSEDTIQTFNLNVVSSKIEDTEFTALINYIEEKGNNVWAKYSLIKHEAISSSKEDALDWLIIFCQQFVEEMKKKYIHYFATDKITTLRTRQEVFLYSDDVTICENSIIWLTQNLDSLIPTTTHDSDKLIINNKNFIPFEISGLQYFDDTDNVENQLVHGFFSEILFFLSELYKKIDENTRDSKPVIFEEFIYFYANKRKLSTLRRIVKSIQELKLFLVQEIPVQVESTEYLSTNKIETKEHYYFTYRKFIEWSLNKSADFSLMSSYFKGIDRLDHLFERACFYKIVDNLEKLNYKIEIVKNSKEYIPQIIKFTKANRENFLHFQSIPPYLATTKRGSNNLLPDFVVELHSKEIIIIDAKYKKETNILKYDIPELTLKYLHGIHYSDGGWNNFAGLIILYPDKDNRKSFYHKSNYTLGGPTPVKPIIGSISVSFEEKDNHFTEFLNTLIQT